MTTPFSRSRIAAAVGMVALAFAAGQVSAAGFALQENSGSGLGNAYAGGAAASEDADTIWTNPAGMSRLKTNQLAMAINMITPSMKFSDGGSIHALNQPLGGNGGDAGSTAWVPNLYLVVPINQQWAFGLGINAPFGLTTEYDSNWAGRYQGIKSKLETINVNPAISYKFGNFAVGAGANYQQIKADLTQALNYSAGVAQGASKAAAAGQITPAAAQALVAQTGGLDGLGDINGDDSAWGWNVGGEWNVGSPDSRTRFGASYRSQIKFNITGNANFSWPSVPTIQPPQLQPVLGLIDAGIKATYPDSGMNADIKMPAIANVSVFHTMLNDKWDFMGDVQWTQWSVVQDLTVVRSNGQQLENLPLKFKNVWRVSAGANYRYTNEWMFRGGIAWDQSPVQDQYRGVRLPDSDRVWLTAGAQYVFSKDLKFDIGAAYIWVQNGSIAQYSQDPATIAQYGYVSGNYNNNVVIVSGQATYSF